MALGVALLGLATFAAACGGSANRELILATTTSTENSGLLDVLIPRYEASTGDHVKVIAVGSGAAIAMGERGDADVLLVHSPDAEQAFVAAGHGVERARVMFNDFVLVGPVDDPAGVARTESAAASFSAIAAAGAPFVSRGDESGTHVKERALWAASGEGVPAGAPWYAETGQGMAATLTIAAQRDAYTLSDRATWLAVGDNEALSLLFEGDPALFNVYHVIVVNPDRHRGVNVTAARRFRDFLLSPAGQRLIGEFGVDEYGQALFTPSAE